MQAELENKEKGFHAVDCELTAADTLGSCKYFSEGIVRVAKPVLSNPNYADILGDKVDSFFSRYWKKEGKGNVAAIEAVSVFDRSLQGRKFSRYSMLPGAALAFGKTRNNLREFDFLRNFLCDRNLDDRIFNTAHIKPLPTDVAFVEINHVFASVRAAFVSYLLSSETIPRSVLFQTINYFHSYLNWHWNFSTNPNGLPRLIVLANDHSPNQVACSMVAKEFGLPRIYIQHAEVSEAFPSLDFDVSILRNTASRDIYERIAPIAGNVFITSREHTPFNEQGLGIARAERVVVGVYLTAQVYWKGLNHALRILNSNQKIKEVFVKPHPALPIQRVINECPPGVDVTSQIPKTKHVAVVANSSVVIELLHMGIPVFQYFGMDTVPDDYYTFSKQGVAPALEEYELKEAFWRRFNPDNEWRKKYARYNPLAERKYAAEEQRLSEILSEYFPCQRNYSDESAVSDGHDISPEMCNVRSVVEPSLKFYAGLLEDTPNTAIDAGQGEGGAQSDFMDSICQNKLINAYEAIFSVRSPVTQRVQSVVRSVSGISSPFVFWVKRREIELTGRAVYYDEVDQMLSFVLSHKHDPKDRKSYVCQLLMFLIRFGFENRINLLASELREIDWRTIPITQKIALQKWLRDKPLIADDIGISPGVFYQKLSPFHQLKLEVLSTPSSFPIAWSHQSIEEKFVETAPSGVRGDFKKFVKPVYEKVRSRMRFMDVRWSEVQRDEFYDLVSTSLRERRPFSLIRLSDGEGYIYGPEYCFFTESDMRKRERHWWRDELTDDLRSEMMPLMRHAAEKADVLGLPCVYRFLRDNADKSKTLMTATQGRGLVEILANILHSKNEKQLYAEEKCNIPLFSDINVIKGIAVNASRLVLIGSAREGEVRKLFSGIRAFAYIPVPTHSRTAENHKYGSAERTLPSIYKDIQVHIKHMIAPGDLVLVAAGVIGKIFVDDAKSAGAVALDIGSSLDEWVDAGIHSLH